MHRELTRIANERSPEKRLELLHKVTDLYLEGIGTHTDAESYLFNDIMEKIVDLFSNDLKQQVSTDLAILPEFPVSIVRALAGNDDIEVARPVLRNANSLNDDDLVLLARHASQAHLGAIAGRATLSEKVTDVLVDRGHIGVVRTVSANHGARFSDQGMDRLVEKAHEDVDLRELLVERPDLSQPIIDKLLPILSESLVTKLAERGYEVRGAIPADMIRALRKRFAAALRTRKEDIRQVGVVIEEIRQGHAKFDDAVRQYADAERLLDVAALMSSLARLNRDHIFNLIYKGHIQTTLMLCRSLDLTWPTLDALLSLRAKKRNERYVSDSKIQGEYETIDAAVAQRMIRFLRVRQVAGAQAAEHGQACEAGAA